MAIYHFSVKNISRSDGRSAVACAAYRSAEKLTCDYYGKEQDYTRKIGVEHTQIYAPENTNINLLNRQKLWNSVEKVERRKDATLAREFEIAFPNELNAEQRKSMLDDLCKKLVENMVQLLMLQYMHHIKIVEVMNEIIMLILCLRQDQLI